MIETCYKYLEDFQTFGYQRRGLFNSEILLIYCMAREMNIRLIIESGIARGHSTYTLAKNLIDTETEIIAIDKDKISDDIKFFCKRLDNDEDDLKIGIWYKDFYKFVKHNINMFDDIDTLVIIDGPKGRDAIFLAEKLLKRSNIKGCFIHDLYSPNPDRDLLEYIFTNTFYTDDPQYVEAFQHLDHDCWELLKGTDSPAKDPYHRRGKKINSYASTLAFIPKQQ
ncbi:MAG: hypothetical protein ACOCTU_07335 [Bacteroidota bacterium]